MKKLFLVVTLLASLVLGSRDVKAQAYGPSYYDPYSDAIQYQQYQQYLQWQQYLAYLQQYDPYYELHMMHYQLYLPPYPSYQLYQPCCFAAGVVYPREASASRFTAQPTGYQSAITSGCSSPATSNRSTTARDQSIATGDW